MVHFQVLVRPEVQVEGFCSFSLCVNEGKRIAIGIKLTKSLARLSLKKELTKSFFIENRLEQYCVSNMLSDKSRYVASKLKMYMKSLQFLIQAFIKRFDVNIIYKISNHSDGYKFNAFLYIFVKRIDCKIKSNLSYHFVLIVYHLPLIVKMHVKN